VNELNTKEKIVESAAKLILVKGYNHTGLKEILDTAGVPKGSFYYYFKNKEDLAIYLLQYYYENIEKMMDKAFEENSKQPILAIKEFMNNFTITFVEKGFTGGCGIGNMGQELSDTEEMVRKKVSGFFHLLEKKIEHQLLAAQQNGFLSEDINCNTYAKFIFNSWQGALLRAKIEKNAEPIKIYINEIFKNIKKGERI
jgi:TetR/AcrR family transcriptional repressor of nem operon